MEQKKDIDIKEAFISLEFATIFQNLAPKETLTSVSSVIFLVFLAIFDVMTQEALLFKKCLFNCR